MRVGAAEVRPRVRFRIWLYVLTLDVLRSLEPTLHQLIVKPPNTFPKILVPPLMSMSEYWLERWAGASRGIVIEGFLWPLGTGNRWSEVRNGNFGGTLSSYFTVLLRRSEKELGGSLQSARLHTCLLLHDRVNRALTSFFQQLGFGGSVRIDLATFLPQSY